MPTPGYLNYQRYSTFAHIYAGQPEDKAYTWSIGHVKCILKNEVYIGHSIHNQQTNISFKNKKKVRKPVEEWFRVENTHEAIISEEDFRRVQEMIDTRRRSQKNGELQLFAGLMIMPHEEQEELIISPVSTTATGDFAACMAMASRFYAEADADFSRRMLEAARRAWNFLAVTEPLLFRNPEGVSTGGYGDHSDADERLWAHVELALSTGEDKYLSAAREALHQADRQHAPLGWGDVRGYAAIEGLRLPGELSQLCRQWVLGAADNLLTRINPYGITMTERLPWGSNMNIANDGMLFHQAWLLTGDAKYRLAAQKQLHYLLGVNPVDYCYVSGFGSKPMRHPHHRPSVALGVCQPGMLSGGAASGLNDPCAREHLQGQPAGKCFIDMHESYSTNEICVYWNSPMVALLAGLS